MEDAAISGQGEREKQNISRNSQSNGRTMGMNKYDTPTGGG